MEPRSAIGEWRADEDRFVLTTGSQGVHSDARHPRQEGVQDRPGEAARHHAGCRRRVRPEGLRLPRISAGAGGRQAARPAGQMDRRPHRAFPRRRARPRQYGRRPRWRSTTTAASWRCASICIANMGAYVSQYGPFIPYIGATMSTGVYDIPALDVTITGVYTNTCPVDAYRGAGRPEAAFLIEKLVDACARELGIGRGRDPPAQFHPAGAVSLPHPDRPALRCRRVRRPHDAGHGARRLGELRPAAEAVEGAPARSAASAWRPISRPAPSPARSRPPVSSTATAP